MDLSRPLIIYSCTWRVYWKFRTSGNLFLYLAKQNPFWGANSSSFSEKIFRILWNSIFSSFVHPIQSNRINSAPLPHVFVQGRLQNYTSSNLCLRVPTQQTNMCLGIHRQTCVATLNPTCLSRLLATKVLLFLSAYCRWCQRYLMYASDDDWDELLLMDNNLLLKVVPYCNSLIWLFQY
jgi:hypothetical protein